MQLAEIQEAFTLFDKDNSGGLGYRELKVSGQLRHTDTPMPATARLFLSSWPTHTGGAAGAGLSSQKDRGSGTDSTAW